jgi:hypothetical protein
VLALGLAAEKALKTGKVLEDIIFEVLKSLLRKSLMPL